MNHLQAFRRPPLHQPTDLQRRLAWLIVSALALALGGCVGGAGIDAWGEHLAELREEDSSDGLKAGSNDRQVTDFSEKAGLRAHLGGAFEPNIEKTEIWPVCDQVTDEFLRKHDLVFEPASTGAFGKDQRGIQSCTFMYGNGQEGVIVLSTNLVTTAQRTEQLEFIGKSGDPRLPNAILLTSPELRSSTCEATMDTPRGRLAVGGAFIDPDVPRELQCELSLEILYDLVSLSQGEFA